MFEKALRDALALDVPYTHQEQRGILKKLKPSPVPAAVLILFAFDGDVPFVLYMLRTETVLTHKGQISFPGGVSDYADGGNPVVTALRETHEEVGISPSLVRTLGEMPTLLTVTGYEISPIVGIALVPLRELALKIDPREVAEVIWVRMDELTSSGTYREELLSYGGVSYPIDVYLVKDSSEQGSHRIWGATGSITKNLLDRLAVLG